MNCQLPLSCGSGRPSHLPPETPRQPWWGLPLGVLLVVAGGMVTWFAIRGLL